MKTYTCNIMSYKYGHLVAQAVDSVMSQTKKPDVIRVIDDGIGDCFHIKDLYPEVEVIKREKNLGIVANFQLALEETTTDRVLFLGADNYLRPDAFEILDRYDEDIVSCNVCLVGTEADKFAEKVGATDTEFGYKVWKFKKKEREAIRKSNFLHGSSVYDVKKAKQFGYEAVKDCIETQEDWQLFKRMIFNGNCSYKQLDEPLLFYRRHNQNFNKI